MIRKIYVYQNYTAFKILGQRFALLIVKIALIMILSNYTLSCEANKKHAANDAIHVFTYASDGLYVQFKKRN